MDRVEVLRRHLENQKTKSNGRKGLLGRWRPNGHPDYGIGARCKAQGSCIGVNYANHHILQSQSSYLNDFVRWPEPIYMRVGYVFESRFSAEMILPISMIFGILNKEWSNFE